MREGRGPDLVALVLAAGLALLVALIALAAIIEILQGGKGGGFDVSLSPNATQLLDTATSGLVAILGGYMGFRYGRTQSEPEPESPMPSALLKPIAQEGKQPEPEQLA